LIPIVFNSKNILRNNKEELKILKKFKKKGKNFEISKNNNEKIDFEIKKNEIKKNEIIDLDDDKKIENEKNINENKKIENEIKITEKNKNENKIIEKNNNYNSTLIVLIGDFQQLSATVISNGQLEYERSLIERLSKTNFPIIMLKEQYRMHPEIRHFPSLKFYNGELRDGKSIFEEKKTISVINLFKKVEHYQFYDLKFGEEKKSTKTNSMYNEVEIDFIFDQILSPIEKKFEENKNKIKNLEDLNIGIISPYSAQVTEIKNKINENEKFKKFFKNILVSTIDSFQGKEKDIIILSCVR
jgi:hypothetical protein